MDLMELTYYNTVFKKNTYQTCSHFSNDCNKNKVVIRVRTPKRVGIGKGQKFRLGTHLD